MKKTNTALKNILTLLLLSLLTLAMVWLGWQQTQRPTATGQQETNTPPPPSPTKTVPIFMGRIVVVTLPPSPTPTSTPIPAMQVISDEPLFDENLMQMIKALPPSSIKIHNWLPSNEMIIESKRLGEESNTWLYNLNTQVLQPTATWQRVRASKEIRADISQFGKRVEYLFVSPDGQWSAGGWEESFLIRKIGSTTPAVDVVQGVEGEFEWYNDNKNTVAWTPQSDLVAYVVSNGPENRTEIRITDPVSLKTNVGIILNFWTDYLIHHLSWSSDGQYLTLEVREEDHTLRHNIYLIKRDGSGLSRLTTHEHGMGPIIWSPFDNKLIYHYQTEYQRADGTINLIYTPRILTLQANQE